MGIKILKSNSVIPGLKISLGITILWMTLIIFLPFASLLMILNDITLNQILNIVTDSRVISSLKVSFFSAFFATLTNVIFGFIVAFVMVKYDFFGKNILNALIDLPFALPTAVAGIALATIYSPNGIIGKIFISKGFIGKFFPYHEIKIAFTPIGIWLALVFVSLPFIVRNLQPILQELNYELEEVAQILGANKFIIIYKIIIPQILPALITGAAMGFARAVGEYGSVIFIAGNIPYVSEIAPLMIVTKLEQFDKIGATVIAIIMLLISFTILLIFNFLYKKTSNFQKL